MTVDRSPESLSIEAVRQQLARILASGVFARSDRMKRFLEYAVEESLQGREGNLKEYNIAVEVYKKPDTFDPRLDPIVRVEASRLRAKLREYYEGDGRNDDINIAIPKKAYAAQFTKGKMQAAEPSQPEESSGEIRTSESSHLMIRGRFHWNRRTPQAIAEAIKCFTSAINMDPSAAAYAGLADCYASQAWFEAGPPEPLWAASEDAARKVLEIDSTLGQPLTTLAYRQAAFEWDWQNAEETFRRAIDLDPGYATAHHWYAMFCLAPQRQLNEALAEMSIARELDPLSAAIATHLGAILYFRRQYGDAVEECNHAIQLDPGFYLAHLYLGLAQAQIGHFDEALQAIMEAHELGDNAPRAQAALGFVYALMGNAGDARDVLEHLKEDAATTYVSPVNFALVYTGLEQKDTAMEWLNQAAADRACGLIHLKVTPAFDSLKTDHRFLRLLSTVKLV